MNNKETYNELDDDIIINYRKIFYILWYWRKLIMIVFLSTLVFFILTTFVLPKKWEVKADLYINKANNSNMVEINPYAIEEFGTATTMLTNNSIIINELELIKSPLVIDQVIKENNLRFKKLFGIIPTSKTGEYLTTEKFLKKGVSFENKKGTNIIEITYKNKDKDLAYNVTNSIITNYITLHKEINSEKAKFDKELIEKEYNQAKANLNKKMQTVNGLPSTALAGAGNLSAMSAYSTSAQNAIANLKGQYVAGEKSQIEIKENAETVSQLASKLEWARLVDEMSDSSKVLVLKEPQKLRNFEYSSPKLLVNIMLGIVFGIFTSLAAVIFKEITDKRLAYSMLGDEIIYDIKKDFVNLKTILLAEKKENIAFVMFDNIANPAITELQKFNNINFIKADISDEFENAVSVADKVVLSAKIGQTDAKLYKLIKQLLERMNKNILVEVLE